MILKTRKGTLYCGYFARTDVKSANGAQVGTQMHINVRRVNQILGHCNEVGTRKTAATENCS